MHRLIAAIGTTLLAVALAGPAAAQGKPDRFPYEPEVIQFDGYCSFPVLLEDDFAKGQVLIFAEDRQGNTRVIAAGVFKGTMTNTETGETLDYTIAGGVTFIFRADGSRVTRAGGNLLTWYSAAEAAASQVGQGIFLHSGRIIERFNTDNELVEATLRGTTTNVCEVLAP